MDDEEEANDVDWAIDELVAAYNAKLHLIKAGKVHPHCPHTGTSYKKKPTYHSTSYHAPTTYQEQAYEYEAPTYTYEEPTYEPTSYNAPHARNALEALSEDEVKEDEAVAVETDKKTENSSLEEVINAVDPTESGVDLIILKH